MRRILLNEALTLVLAVQFLTRIPITARDAYSPERLTAAARYYPLVGALVGSILASVYAVASMVLPAAVSAIVTIGTGLLLTGAFHEDGLADTADGLGGGATREDALAIMRDSRLGTYGTAALIIVLLLKVAVLTSLSPFMAAIALVAAHSLSRLSAVFVIATSHYVRDEGTGKPTAQGLNKTSLTVALITGLAVVAGVLVLVPPFTVGAALTGLLAGHMVLRFMVQRKLGGYTGDTLGAVQQSSETGFLMGFVTMVA